MNSLNKTFLPTKNYKNRNWFIIDCKGQKLGRLATIIAALLKGKIKPQYDPSIDTGDYVILINADSIILNESSKHYIVNKPGRPGRSLKIKNVVDCLPKFTIERAVKGMLSETETKRLMRRLKIYSNEDHSHQAQAPILIDVSNFADTQQFSV
uniref:ribosomal protein L13 n=1 Tax=Haslea karadagensis TaxID=1146996 RepID=UPI002204E509|nr:ribosomal protein L13 [Haslea karadagensis]UXN44920.1 ribosomal protein L13 [Haslea karadagensis]UXN45051.1 ribosomal protein L13 [Haslea karadagensis]UXN45181.1 ribosomal protein L13 [Haslea karadagensis]